MSVRSFVSVSALLIAASAAAPAQNSCGTGAAYFAATVAAYQPGVGVTAGTGFGIPGRILCAPGGFSDVVSLGVQGSVTVGFDIPVVNGPGTDFLVWENGFEFGGVVFGELGFVEVSTDGLNFARFPSAFVGPQAPVAQFGGLPAGAAVNLAGLGLLLAPLTPLGFSDPCQGGGDPFDLDDLATHPAVVSGIVDLQNVRYVRIVDVLGDGSSLDAAGVPIWDPVGGNSSSDWDAIAVVHHQGNQDPARPRIAISFNTATRELTIGASDAGGLQDFDWSTLRATFNDVAFDFVALLPLFPNSLLSSSSITLTSIPLPPGTIGKLCLSVSDFGGLAGADCGALLP